MEQPREKRDLVLPPGTYAYMQDVTKGVIKVYTGPTVINPTAQERPVKYDRGTFKPCDLDGAQCISPVAVEGYYLTLLNPAIKDAHPSDGSAMPSPDLDVGRKINIPGPTMFALWPGQSATVTRGHHLRYNQYLLVRVYNDAEAKANWSKGVMKPVAGAEATATSTGGKVPDDLTLGKLYIIKGTEFSFYIPPTGITVVQDEKGEYVRDALTLERLEYAILIDEDGTKRYEYGPQVVFPMPTEKFFKTKGRGDGTKDNELTIKFRAVELNPIQGLHVKVIADYVDEKTKVEHKTGEELFITGTETAIYYPREEHAIIKYDGKTKQFATAIPAGEGRYVLNRQTGAIKMVRGPAMLLPDPRTEVIVRRVLTDKQCELWYPGNAEALQINRDLRNVMQKSPTTRAGAVSEGDISRAYGLALNDKSIKGKTRSVFDNYNTALGTAATVAFADASQVSGDQYAAGEEISRGSTYTQPRSITLDTKYQGAPNISLWAGYAVMIVGKTGQRRVEVGPKNILLEYDEDLEVVGLSTGKPKTTDKIYQTVYLRTENNTVTDILDVETSDHVGVRLKLGYRVDYTPEASSKWFSVENYVKFLCDHNRSILKGVVRGQKVESFYANATDFIRNTILGTPKDGKRTGMAFPQNGMVIDDVEVLAVEVIDPEIKALLNGFQQQTVRTNIDLAATQRAFEVKTEKEEIARKELEAGMQTSKLRNELAMELEASAFAVKVAQLGNSLTSAAKQREVDEALIKNAAAQTDAKLVAEAKAAEQRLQVAAAEQAQRLNALAAETEATVKRLGAAQAGFSEALLALSNNETMVKVAEAWSIQRVIGGDSVSEAINKAFAGTTLEGVMKTVTGQRPVVK